MYPKNFYENLNLNLFFNNKLFQLVFVLLVSIVLYRFLTKYILKLFFNFAYRNIKDEEKKQKIKTVVVLLNNVIKTIILVVVLVVVFDILGFNIAPILTGAGIVGLAVSFGSQSIVKDIVSGIFIILENQINVGDNVKIGSYEGRVKELTLRSIYLIDDDKNLIIIPNSQVSAILKYKKNNEISKKHSKKV
ncbi:MAG: hypothetical protein KatS3mg090_0670 [Patescibacteria group bacterium]|nr:MAG: hypothetical protein KatS3mg090_0670 [Patescibacteria group bacterium]